MNHRKILAIGVGATLAGFGAQAAFAHDGGKSTFVTGMSGYEETPATLSTPGSGEFAAKVSKDGTRIDWVLTYRNLESDVTQAHIHFARPALSGPIVLFLCTNLGNAPSTVPTPQACPPAGGTISGSLTQADVIANGNGIDSGAVGFAEKVKAIRNGAAYANVHTTGRPSGEIRGGLGKVKDDDGDDHDDDD
jgi:hypothetical protein